MNAAEKFIEANGYEGVVALIKALPMTWLPALTVTMVEAGYERGVWRPGGCSGTVSSTERRIDQAALAQPAQGDRRRVCEVCRSSYDVAVAQPGSAPGAAEVKASVKSEVAGSNPARPSLSAAQSAPREVVATLYVTPEQAGADLVELGATGTRAEAHIKAVVEFYRDGRLVPAPGVTIARVVEGGS